MINQNLDKKFNIFFGGGIFFKWSKSSVFFLMDWFPLPRQENPVCSTIYLELGEEQMDSFLSQGQGETRTAIYPKGKVKHKQPYIPRARWNTNSHISQGQGETQTAISQGQGETQTAISSIWTWISDSIFYNDNHCAKCPSSSTLLQWAGCNIVNFPFPRLVFYTKAKEPSLPITLG